MIGRPNETTIRQRVWALVEPVCADAGYDLVDVRLVTEQSGWVLRILIDATPDERDAVAAAAPADDAAATAGPAEGDIDLNDCERVSREVSAVLDVDDTIAVAYSLEVSSPGIDRPLVTEAHFRRYVGAEIRATLHRGVPTASIAGAPSTDRKNFRGLLVGVEGAGKDARAKLIVDGAPWLLPIDDVDQARIVPDWDAVMKGGRGQIRTPEPAGKPGSKRGHAPHPMAKAQAKDSSAKAKAHAHGGGHELSPRSDSRTQGARNATNEDEAEPADSTTSPRRDDKPAT